MDHCNHVGAERHVAICQPLCRDTAISGLDLLCDIDVTERGVHRVGSLHDGVPIDVADRPVIVGDGLEPVLRNDHHHFGGECLSLSRSPTPSVPRTADP